MSVLNSSFFILNSSFRRLFRRNEIDEQLWNELEETLIGADAGVATADELVTRLRGRARAGDVRTADEALAALQQELARLLVPDVAPAPLLEADLTTILVVGVNGGGKTTTVAKLANHWRSQGRRVVVAAGDTFRAAGS